MRLLYSYITNPFQTIQIYRFQSIAPISMAVLFLVSFIFSGVVDGFFVLRQLFWMLTIGVQLFIMSAYIDFTARILGYESNSYYLFRWLSLALLPLLLFQPLSVFASSGILSSSITGGLGILVIGFISVLVFTTIRAQVHTESLTHDVLLIALPILVMVAFVLITIMYFGVLVSTGTL